MAIPMDLLLVRHGESEGNVAIRAARAGDESIITDPAFRSRHSSNWRLTERGVEQAHKAGAWIASRIDLRFDRCYTSADLRAIKTASNLNLSDAYWDIELLLRGRAWGDWETPTAEQRRGLSRSAQRRKDSPSFWRPEHGESIAEVVLRTQHMLDKLEREDSGKRVLVVCHSEVIRAFHFILTGMTTDEYERWRASGDQADRIQNGQIFHYTRRDPWTGMPGSRLKAWCSIPTSEPLTNEPAWRRLQPRILSNNQLLSCVEPVPRLMLGN